MSGNVLQVSDLLAHKILAQYVAQLSFIATANRDTQDDMVNTMYKPGNQINVLRRNRFLVSKTLAVTAQPTVEEFDTVVLRQPYSVTVEYDMVEATQYLDRYEDRVIRPAMAELIKSIEADISLDAANSLYQVVGTPGSAINSFAAVDACGVYLGEHDISLSDSYMALNLQDASNLKSQLQPQFNKTLNEEISFGSRLGYLSTFDIFQNNTIIKHVSGAAGGTSGITVNGMVSTGNTIVLAGLPQSGGTTLSNAILQGDIIILTSNNINSTSWLQRVDTGYPASFVVQTFTPGSAGAGTVTVGPSIISSNTTPNQNITAPIPSGTTVSILASHKVNAAYDRTALSLVNPPLQPLMCPYSETRTDEDSLLSINVSIEGGALSGQNIMRISALVGWIWHPQYAVRFVS